MQDLLKVTEMVNGRVEFLPNYWNSTDPNLTEIMRSQLENFVREPVKTQV